MIGGSAAADAREFDVVWRGYDREQVKAYLSEVETSFHQLESWAEEANEAMIAAFAAKDRVLERGRIRAGRIESEAAEQAHVDYEDVAAAIIDEAKEEARRIVEGALVTSEPVSYESILGESRAEADRMIENARTLAERLMARSPATVQGSEDATRDSLVVDLADHGSTDEAESEGELRATRYTGNSAGLPSIGEDTPV